MIRQIYIEGFFNVKILLFVRDLSTLIKIRVVIIPKNLELARKKYFQEFCLSFIMIIILQTFGKYNHPLITFDLFLD